MKLRRPRLSFHAFNGHDIARHSVSRLAPPGIIIDRLRRVKVGAVL